MITSVIFNKQISYPDSREFFSPSECYPEYQFKHTASRPNLVYRTVRECLLKGGLDKFNVGKASWNPLRYLIPEGSSVFVLCNFVYHKRPYESWSDFYAKCTHGSVLRAVIDYILLAVGETGNVKFGNAPVQSCNWDRILEETGAAKVSEFYNKDGRFSVESSDLRSHVVVRHLLGGITKIDNLKEQNEVVVDLGKDSLLEELYTLKNDPKFRIMDYSPNITTLYHDKSRHVYIFNKEILEADIIVSIAKLKTHEKAGVTLGIKSSVGGIAHKHCLAHYRLGCPKNGGDEYQNGQLINWIESELAEYARSRANRRTNNVIGIVLFMLRKIMRRGLRRNVGGGWHGNDTTWRMGMDIARILKNADNNGTLCDAECRKIIEFIDGIISGEGDGPLSPKARRHGFLSYSDDLACGDFVAACFMGLNPEEYPILREAFHLPTYPLTNAGIHEIKAIVNGLVYNHDKLTSLVITPFRLPPGWAK